MLIDSKVKYTFLIILFSSLSSNTWAFKKRSHGKISTVAFKKYITLTKRNITRCYMNAFVAGSKYEDKLTQAIKKSKNQHFHRPDSTLERSRHFLSRLSSLFKELDLYLQEDDYYNYWKTLGKISHYYQDMACPPHTIPIYHLGEDSFDNIPVNNSILRGLNVNLKAIQTLSEMKSIDLLNHYHTKTIKALRDTFNIQINSDTKKATWNWFWTRETCYISAKHFGSYGVLGNNYGKTEFSCQSINKKSALFKFKQDTHFMCQNETIIYKVDLTLYTAFSNKQLQQALEATMALIDFGYKKMYRLI